MIKLFMDFLIERLQLKELNQFWQVFKEVISNDFPDYSKKVIEHFLEKLYNQPSFHYWIINNFKIVYVVKLNNKIVGFIVLDKPYGGVCFCRWLGVLKNYRNKGIGRQLITIFISFAKNYGCHKVELASQPESKVFYEKCNLILEGKRNLSYFGIDQFIFGKVISQPKDKIMTKD